MRLTIALRTAIAAGVISATIAGSAPVSAQNIKGAGASFPAPIYQKWFFEYNKSYASVTFNYAAILSGGGLAQYKAGTVDFGATDAPLSDADQSSMPQPTLHIPTVAGAVVMAYNGRNWARNEAVGRYDCRNLRGQDNHVEPSSYREG